MSEENSMNITFKFLENSTNITFMFKLMFIDIMLLGSHRPTDIEQTTRNIHQ